MNLQFIFSQLWKDKIFVETFTSFNQIPIFEEQLCMFYGFLYMIFDTDQVQIFSVVYILLDFFYRHVNLYLRWIISWKAHFWTIDVGNSTFICIVFNYNKFKIPISYL